VLGSAVEEVEILDPRRTAAMITTNAMTPIKMPYSAIV
jgi:hypothetical protein